MDTIPNKTESNRRNAQKSTGPKTQEGKAIVAHNALKHGLLSESVLLAYENPEVFQKLRSRLRVNLKPVGELEEILANRVVSCVWRLGRLNRVETEIFTYETADEEAERAHRKAESYRVNGLVDMDFTRISDQEKYDEAILRSEEAVIRRQKAVLGLAFIRDGRGADAFSKLSRYERGIENSLYRNLHELQRLQSIRHGHRVPPPVALDVNVSNYEAN